MLMCGSHESSRWGNRQVRGPSSSSTAGSSTQRTTSSHAFPGAMTRREGSVVKLASGVRRSAGLRRVAEVTLRT